MMSRALRTAGRLLCLLALLTAPLGRGACAAVLVMDGASLDLQSRHLAASLQGIANRTPDGPSVFISQGSWDAAWLSYALLFSPQPTEAVSLDGLLAAVKPRLEGQVLYDPAQPFTLDVATTLAGIRDAAVTAQDLGLPTLYNLRNRWQSADEAYAWVTKTLLSRVNRTQFAVLSPDSAAMRDYAVQQHMLTISPPPGPPSNTLREVLYHFSPGTAVFGARAPDLTPTFNQFSFHFVPAAQAANLSFYSRLPAQKRYFQYPGHIEPTAPRYLTLLFDCSDLGFTINQMPDLWEHSARGAVPLGWAVPGALASAAPPVAHRYYSDAYRSGTDQFVLGASGAGELAVAQAESPDAFYAATARTADLLDAHTALYAADPSEDLAGAVARLASESRLQGVFLLTAYDQPPVIYAGIPALATPRVDTVQQAITYLNRLPLDRRFAALCLNPWTLGPADAAHLAAHVASRYVAVPPVELMALVIAAALTPAEGPPAVTVTSVEYPQGVVDPSSPVPIKAELAPVANLFAASVVYRPAHSRFGFAQRLEATSEGFAAELPPLRWGGAVELKVRAIDTNGRVAWSPLWTIDVARQDSDGDGASDAEETFRLTDPHHPDTDGDGLTDANDLRPLDFERYPSKYFGPIYPPAEVPYLSNPAESEATEYSRFLKPGQTADYWLPAGRLPPGGSAAVRVEGTGPAVIAVGPDPSRLATQYDGQLDGRWHSAALAAAEYPSNVYLRLTCPRGAASPLTIFSLALVSPREAPSITQVRQTPMHPGPEQPITVSAVVFSPAGVAGADLVYRVNGRGQIAVPMAVRGQQYSAVIPALENRDQLEYWIAAREAAGHLHATSPPWLWIGGRGREVVSLLARRDFVGGWRPSQDWNEAASFAPDAGVEDTAAANLTGGGYTVWVLAGGRGNGIAVSVDGKRVGAVDPDRPDGWQQVGRVRLEAGRRRVTLTSEAVAQSDQWSPPRYAAVILSTDSTFQPPADQVFDVVNALVLLSPDVSQPLRGAVPLRATGAGNLLGLEFSLDGEAPRRVSGPPFSFTLSTSRYANGPHTLKLEAVDRTGPTGLALSVPITISNP